MFSLAPNSALFERTSFHKIPGSGNSTPLQPSPAKVTVAISIPHSEWFKDQFSNLPKGFLVGGFNPFEKYARQIGSFPR